MELPTDLISRIHDRVCNPAAIRDQAEWPAVKPTISRAIKGKIAAAEDAKLAYGDCFNRSKITRAQVGQRVKELEKLAQF